MGWTGCVRFKIFWDDFVAQSFALIALIQPILHRVSCSHEMVPNAPKYYETQQTMSLGSNGVDRVCLLRQIPTQLRGLNFCINCTSSDHFASSLKAVTKWIQMHPNTTKRNKTWVQGPMGGIGCVLYENFRRDFVARTFALLAPV